VEIQRVIGACNRAVPAARRMEYRIGVHLGDVVIDTDRIYGDGVNIAARLQALAEPGGICVSAAVQEQVGKKLGVSYRDLGPQALKNIPERVRAFHVRAEGTAVRRGMGRRWRRSVLAVGAVAAAAAAVFSAWRLLPTSPGPIRSIAVLPLENLSGDPEQEYFADGMTETLIGDLGKIGALKLISRTSVMRYKGARKPLPEIAAELGVDALLEGTVIRDGDRVRVTAQLIDGRTDHHLWSERYDRELRGILELQSDAARAVAREVELELSPTEVAQLAERQQVDAAAHEALLRGIYQFGRPITPESMRSALASFERAIELDPGYAEAHAWLAFAWLFLTNAVYQVPDREGMPRAKSAALRALELDEAIPEAHGVLGTIALNFDWDWPASERHFQRAFELNASAPWPHAGYAWHLFREVATSRRSQRRAGR
jgi:TolB-like protein